LLVVALAAAAAAARARVGCIPLLLLLVVVVVCVGRHAGITTAPTTPATTVVTCPLLRVVPV
jgi:hypothetical protein